MSTEFNGYILRDAREYRNQEGRAYPVVPDINDPLLSIAYAVEAWCGVYGRPAKTRYNQRADELGIVECEIQRHKMVRLSNLSELIACDEKRPAKE